MKRHIRKQEVVAAVLIIGSAAWYWQRPSQPPIVFAGEAGSAAADRDLSAETNDVR